MHRLRNTCFILFVALTGCSKKKQVLSTENSAGPNGETLVTTTYIDRDSLFRETRSAKGITSLLRCANEQELNDSTFTVTDFYPGGKPQAFRQYAHGKQSGRWRTWYPDGKEQSSTRLENGLLTDYRLLFENGETNISSSRQAEGRLERSEFLPGGALKNRFTTDSAGNGIYREFYPNGRLKQQGNLFHFDPSGVWKRFDTAGKPLPDTLFGMRPLQKK